MLFIGLTLLGYVSYKQLSLELLPNVEQPYLVVQARMPQESDPDYVENAVVIPLEGAVGSLEGIESIESNITSSSGTITAYYLSSIDANLAYLKLQEKINEVESSLPEGVNVSVNRTNTNQMSNSQFMTLLALSSEGTDHIRNVVEEDVVNELENIEGIAGVSVFGGQEKSLEIILDKKACEAYNITPNTISSLLSQNSVSRSYVGNLHEKEKLYFVHVTSEYNSIKDIENLIVADGPILLRDVATVRFGVMDITSYSRINGLESVSIQLINDSQANQIDLSHEVEDAIGTLNEKLRSQDVELVVQTNSAESMEENINQIINLALIGGLMAVFVLWVFLKNIRIVAFIALGIPISVYIAFNFFYAYDITLNSLTLVGMALAVGMLLDNSVVVLENVYRLAGQGYDPDRAVIQGTSEVWRSIVAATLTTVTVFLPFLFSSDYLIEMIGLNVGVSIISTLMVSLFVALLFVPMTIHFILKRRKKSEVAYQKVSTDNRLVQIYMVLLKTCMRNPAGTIIGAVIIFFLVVFLSLSVSTSSLTEVESDQINVSIEMPSGTSLDKTDELVRQFEEDLSEVPEKKDVTSNVQEGQATVTVSLVDDYEKINNRSFAEIRSSINELTRGYSRGVDFNVSSSASAQSGGGAAALGGGMAGNFQALLGIGTNQESIILKGEDYSVMQSVAEDLEYYIEDLDFIQRVNTSVSSSQPEVHMIFDPLLMTENDIDIQSVSSGFNTFSNEISTGIMFQDGLEEYEITISLDEDQDADEDDARTMDDLKVVQVNDANGGVHDLQDFTQLVYTRGTGSINRVNQEKEVEITYQMNDDAQESNDLLEQYRMEIDELVAGYAFPSGIAVEVIHESDELNEFYFLIFAAIILIFMIMASVFESIATPFVLLFSIPLAAIGSLGALLLTGNSLLSANTLIGFLILLGIVVNNGIILIDYTNILRGRGFRRSRALMTAGLSRVRPILITATTTIVAMIPLAMGDAEYVSVIGAPFAIVVIGGLTVSTLLTLIFVPTFYSGLENSLEWFKSLGWKLKTFQLTLMALIMVYVYYNVADLVWQMVDIFAAVIVVPGATWFVLNSLKKAGTKLIAADETVHISVQNLVKIYDRPSRFAREWNGGQKLLKRLGLLKEFKSLKEFSQLIWQIPLLIFLIFFTFFYLEQSLWICFMMMMIYMYIRAIWKPITIYWDNLYKEENKKIYNFLSKKSNKFLFWFLPLIELVIFYYITYYVGLTIVYAILWYLGLIISVTSKKLYEENINVDRITGRFGKLRRGTYRLIKQIPIIGKRRVPFRALDGVSFEIGTGMFGLLGPNGAGKSTMMRTICGILEQSYGKIYINGIDTQEKREELQGLIGYLPQAFGMYENMSSWDYLDYQAILKGLTDKKVREERLEYVLKSVHMWDRKDDKIGSYSGGMKQRIGIAQILLHLPRILVVDEPTAGLDPRERIRFRNLLVQLSRERIVIFSTHIIEDISSSCNHVGVIIRGRVKYHGEPINMVSIADDLVWQYDVPKAEFDKMPNKQMVTHHMNVGDNIRVRILSKEQPDPKAVKVKPLLEDAYLCLIKDLK